MIKANELRIGNWIADFEAGGVFQIEEICKVGNQYNVSYRNGSIICAVDVLDPIPITEDWLLKLGFEKTMTWTYTIDLLGSLKLVYYLGEKGWSLGFKNYSDFSNLKYLHELQNLYFALTGKELEMKGGNNE
jgi:hypothetical protein